MIKSIAAAEDGIHVRKFATGEEYLVSDRLAKILIEDTGSAELVIEEEPKQFMRQQKQISEAPEKTVIEKAPENAMIKESPKNKQEKKVRMRVFQLADELSVGSKIIIKIAKELNINVAKVQSGLSSDEVERIKVRLKKTVKG